MDLVSNWGFVTIAKNPNTRIKVSDFDKQLLMKRPPYRLVSRTSDPEHYGSTNIANQKANDVVSNSAACFLGNPRFLSKKKIHILPHIFILI
jgi:hypothetical protein